MKYEHVLRALTNEPWLILPQKMTEVIAMLELRAAGHSVSAEQIEAAVSQQRQPVSAGTAVAVLPIMGVIHRRANLMSETSGGVTTERLSRAFSSALADPQIGSVLLHVDSPGGQASGIQELGDLIYSARGVKPVVAVADGYAASAAYWLATAAEEMFISPSSEVGSIGAVLAHQDISAMEELDGIKTTLIYAGEHKVFGNEHAPLSDEDRGYLQEMVDRSNDQFVTSVARHRGVTKAVVNSSFGQGLMFGAKDAVRLGMADRVGTVDDAVARAVQLARRGGGARGRAAAAVAGLEIRERERARGLTGLLKTR